MAVAGSHRACQHRCAGRMDGGIRTGVGETVPVLLELYARVRAVAPQRRVQRVLVDRLRVQLCGLVEVVRCTRSTLSAICRSHCKKGHAQTNALFASALYLAASARASSVTSCRVSFESVGEGGGEEAGVDAVGVDGCEPEEASLGLAKAMSIGSMCSRASRQI